MAYADPLDETQPPGNTKAKLGDDAIRTHIRAIRQRLSSIFVDIDADPLVLKPGVISTGMLIDALVTTAKLADLNVATAKLADRAVTAIKLGLAAVLPEHIGAGVFVFPDVDSVAGYKVNGAAVAGKFLKGDGNRFVPTDFVAGDIPDAVLQKLLMHIEGWYVTNVPGTSVSFMGRYASSAGNDRLQTLMTRAGEVRKIWVRGEADRTAGSLTIQIYKNGANVAAASAVIDAANPRWVVADVGAGVIPFAAGDLMGIWWQTVGFTPNNTTHIAGFDARYT